MSGFKNFILRGNLVEIAVGLIMALSFAAVVTSFAAWLTNLLPDRLEDVFAGDRESTRRLPQRRRPFVSMGAVVYFLVVCPTPRPRRSSSPPRPRAPQPSMALLTEIRDSLSTRP